MRLTKDPTLLREGQLQRFLRSLHKKNCLSDSEYKDIYPSGSRPARIYGLPKTHKLKQNDKIPPFRPIVSSIGTYNYNLAKLLANKLHPLIPKDYCATDTFSFVNELQTLNCSDNITVSFDVVSLFTNVPLHETIDLAVNYIYDAAVAPFSKADLKKLFLFATAQTHFTFKSNIYDQIDGVAMGSPLGPVLTDRPFHGTSRGTVAVRSQCHSSLVLP